MKSIPGMFTIAVLERVLKEKNTNILNLQCRFHPTYTLVMHTQHALHYSNERQNKAVRKSVGFKCNHVCIRTIVIIIIIIFVYRFRFWCGAVLVVNGWWRLVIFMFVAKINSINLHAP